MENTLSNTPNPFAGPIDPEELTKLLVSLMPPAGHPYQIQLRMLEFRQAAIEQSDDELIPYKPGVIESIDTAIQPLIKVQSMPTTWLEVSKMLTKAKDFRPALFATYFAMGLFKAFGDIRV